MLNEQKKLLEGIRANQATALKLVNGGVKISGVFQSLRRAGDELEARVRAIEKQPKPVTAPKPTQTTQLATKEQLIETFAQLDPKGQAKTLRSIEAALKENPDRADAKIALEAIKEVMAKTAQPKSE